MGFDFLDHTADIKFRAWGKTLDEAFAEAARAFSFYVSKEKEIKVNVKKVILIKGSDMKSLLYNFLDELVYLMDAEHFIVGRAKVNIDGTSLRATLSGDDCEKYTGLKEVKAATYADMEIEESFRGWEVQAVMDV